MGTEVGVGCTGVGTEVGVAVGETGEGRTVGNTVGDGRVVGVGLSAGVSSVTEVAVEVAVWVKGGSNVAVTSPDGLSFPSRSSCSHAATAINSRPTETTTVKLRIEFRINSTYFDE